MNIGVGELAMGVRVRGILRGGGGTIAEEMAGKPAR